ncbi:MAG: hypothetical protein M0042_13855 [Nitrospiraceae bacterium]|nr:hypothetical protein [Nitrospiraceae bacterium]
MFRRLSAAQKRVILLIIACKIVVLALFSSEYQDKLFLPFVQYFLTHGGNPWQHFQNLQPDMFPYPPLMLYIESLAYLPVHLLGIGSVAAQNFFFKLPTLAADLAIAVVLLRLFPSRFREVMLFYFASPIVLYASYMHSQLDLLPMAVLMLAVVSLSVERVVLSALLLGLAMSIKFHVVAALPLMLIYQFRTGKKAFLIPLALIPAAVYLAISSPFLASEGYSVMVLRNPKQMKLFDAVFSMGDVKIYLPVFAVAALYARFAAYPKINSDLFHSFLGMLFAAFVLLILPSPAWYLWMIPFLSIFFIQYSAKHESIVALYAALCAMYLVYFIVFHLPDYQDLSFLGGPIDLKVRDEKLRNMAYSVLEVVLFATIYSMYKFGVKSNAVYRRTHNLIIGIGGDSASGKSTLLTDLKLLLGTRLLELEGDADHRWERGDEHWQSLTHLDPKANYLHKQAEDLLELKYGRRISRTEYDHDTGRFTEERKIEPRDFIVLSGLHPFYLPISRKVIDLKIYLDTEEALRRRWKISRDMQNRGYDERKVLEQIERRMDDARKYIHPQREHADVTVCYGAGDGRENAEQRLTLKVTLSSNVHIEELLKRLEAASVAAAWDYSDDLKNQYVTLATPPRVETIRSVAYEVIPNIQELIPAGVSWQDGYRGFVQLVVLLVLSEKIREEGREREV